MDDPSTMIRLAFFACAFAVSTACAAATDGVQRQLQQREQSQAELRLRMEQQRDRAGQPPHTPAEDLRRRTLEREQQQRLRQLHDRQTREGVAAPETQRDIKSQRAPQIAAEELKRFERERAIEAERGRIGQD